MRLKPYFLQGSTILIFLKVEDKGGILSSIDRENLKELLQEKFRDSGYTLAPSPEEQMYTQRLYLYMNLCKLNSKSYTFPLLD